MTGVGRKVGGMGPFWWSKIMLVIFCIAETQESSHFRPFLCSVYNIRFEIVRTGEKVEDV